MLTAEIFSKFGQPPWVLNGSYVVVRDDHSNPLVVAVRQADGSVVVLTANDELFPKMLQHLGIDKVVLADQLQLEEPPDGAKLLDDGQLAGFLNGS